ncbi:3'-5' exonuclease (plasmid) [Streptomyces halstedii]|uniref:3'-5' exonuclease n=1 Tax=Streptomyces halstedii TaxID=1944 RepID=UPI002F90DDFB
MLLAGRLVLLGPVGQAMHWAYAMLQPQASVLIDLETTGLDSCARIVEVAVVNTHDGSVALDTLLDPGVRIPPAATAVHRITDAMVTALPGWDAVLPQVLAVTRGRKALSYNADFERRLIAQHSRFLGLDAAQLKSEETWGCVMKQRSAWLGTTSWRRLSGGHRALGDCLAALDVLKAMTKGRGFEVSEGGS